MSADTDVAICIPTYQAEEFIERTLTCAQLQTHQHLRIIVSVDACDDRTADICQRIADKDSRILLLIQDERQGWSKNANVALDAVDSDYFFLYFHDDIIEPTYVETLLKALKKRTDAASAHCDLVEFGLANHTKPAHTYDGSTLHRLIDFMMTKRGTTLRSLVRRSAVGHSLRFPQIYGDNHWTAYVFHMLLLAAGPAVGVHQPLYRRWQRQGSLTRSKGWEYENIESLLRGLPDSITHGESIINTALTDPDERATANYCLKLMYQLFVRQQQLQLGNHDALNTFIPPIAQDKGESRLLRLNILGAELESIVSDTETLLRATERQLLFSE